MPANFIQKVMMMNCPFCNRTDFVMSNVLAYAIYDRHPVTPGHMLIIPYRHCPDYFQSTAEERVAMSMLLDRCRDYLEEKYQPDGYNVGINCGETAGQTIWHVHVHLIPRYAGDAKKPRGGVRGVIPEKMSY